MVVMEALLLRVEANDSNPATISEPLRKSQATVECAVTGQDIQLADDV